MSSSRKTRKKKTKEEEEVEKIKEKERNRAEQLVLEKFPKKIIELKALFNNKLFREDYGKHSVDINIPYPEEVDQTKPKTDEKQFLEDDQTIKDVESSLDEDSDEEEASRCARPWLFPCGEVPSNKRFVEMIEVLRPFMLEFIYDLDTIYLGIELLEPKIEDGNNFGVDVQKETLETIERVRNEIHDSFDGNGDYFKYRADLVTKVVKFPQSDDYRKAIKEVDDWAHIGLINDLKDLHKHYTTIHDIVTKNLNKIKQPKAVEDNILSMY